MGKKAGKVVDEGEEEDWADDGPLRNTVREWEKRAAADELRTAG